MPATFDSPPSWGLVLVRIVSGWILLVAGWQKVSHGVTEDLVLGTRAAFESAPALVRAWGENVVLPHPFLFAQLIAWGELTSGLALFLGALTRPAGYAAAFMMANFFLVGPESGRDLQLLLATCCFACAVSRAGLRAGADAIFAERLPAWMTWMRY
jgi:thiosulfate dehydrogenase [quinone] large subunit